MVKKILALWNCRTSILVNMSPTRYIILHFSILSLRFSFQLKTTSPEKFSVKPSTGCLAPGETVTIIVTLLQGYQIGGLSRDKFLVMSIPLGANEISNLDLSEFWKVGRII